MNRLVVVSNRVALPGKRGSAEGGLATGLARALEERGGLWFGWNGRVAETADSPPALLSNEAVNYATVPLTRREYDEYYVGFANRCLWPLCHSRLNLLRFKRREYQTYLNTNARFAQQLLPLLSDAPLIWVHDYHLLALGERLRQAGVRSPLGFFLHVPFPCPCTLRALPPHRELVRALLAYDLLGFQTIFDCDAFLGAVRLCVPEARVEERAVSYGGRRVRVLPFPIGIDVDEVAQLAERGRSGLHGKRLEASLTGRQLIIGVDRLDYSKGLPDRFRAYGQLLEHWPAFRRQVVLFQIAPLSRTEVPEYDSIRRELNAIAGDLHGRYADYDWLPLRYMTRGFPRRTIMGFLSLARVGLVTPLRDGMNLVAKEFVAAQPAHDPGVLVLSSLAGAAQELKDALIVNPYDGEQVAEGLAQALSMPVEERRERWSAMMKVLRDYDIHHWAQAFVHALAEGAGA
ncbi:MAG: trehalose-6-phosphate synthase [Gammaproteobacteria bacterium]|nr:trehalose-6-phosphate synthase [Gammaproteobacteria bacterium]MDE2024203.1 trehalose-6-phosphate synthase [Gammaproteobacteria bacterium]MDE2140055.1 trehalose-6-phosphate synthase [Gammaproteobacteria bacterium]